MLSKLLLASILFASVVWATEVEEVFNAHKDEILSATGLSFDQYVYGVGHAPINSRSKSAKQTALERAELQANTAILEEHQLASIVWPTSFTKEDIRVACDLLHVSYPFNIKAALRYVVRVFAQAQETECVVVSGVEQKNIQRLPRLTFEQVYPFLISQQSVISSDVPIEFFCKFYALKFTLPHDIDRTPWEKQLEAATFSQPTLRRFAAICGRFPLGKDAGVNDSYHTGMKYYRQNDLTNAYEAFVESVAENYNFDALNMAGNVARRLGKFNEAVPLLLQAHYLTPSSPYPMVHLAWVAKSLEMPDVVDKILTALRSYQVDAWSSEQIKQLQP